VSTRWSRAIISLVMVFSYSSAGFAEIAQPTQVHPEQADVQKTPQQIQEAKELEQLSTEEFRMILTGADSIEIENKKFGRLDKGSIYICAHGDQKSVHAIVDWRPFEYYTYETQIGPGLSGTITTRFISTESGTHVIATAGRLQGSLIARNRFRLQQGKLADGFKKGVDGLRDFIIQELETGATVRPEASSVPAEQVTAAAQASLAEAGAD